MISIIIPTCKSANLIPCLESIRKYTELAGDVEIIVVMNGYDHVKFEAPEHIKIVWFDQMIGYPAACNAGIRASTGDFIVLLNDDTELLPQQPNQWLDILSAPFSDPEMAITGPWMMHNTEINKDFLCFFCCMIRKSALDKIGLLDEAFGAGYAEDVDLCCRAIASGYRIAQVPNDGKVPYDGRIGVGAFPIYHQGNQTFQNWPGGHELMAKNHAILRARYSGVTIENAKKLGEWMSDEELLWLARRAKESKVFVELGSWFGKSSTAIADNLPEDGILYCIDTWQGSKSEQDTNHVQARDLDGDFAFNEFLKNLWRHVETGKLRPIRMHGVHAAKLLQDLGVKADTIFIDAGHTREEAKEDVLALAPLMREGTKENPWGAIICGHDYHQPAWPGVTEAVEEIFGGNFSQVPNTNIWATDCNPLNLAPPAPRAPRGNIYECIMFNNEFDMLEWQFTRMWDVVDRFVIVEATVNHAGKPKPLHFKENIERFSKYLSKVSHVVVEDCPPMNGSEVSAWAIERHQRDGIMRALTQCKENDVIIVVDCDEVPDPVSVKNWNPGDSIAALRMDLYLYDYKVKAVDPWLHAKIMSYGKLSHIGPNVARYMDGIPQVVPGGEHLSYFGGIEKIVEKIHNTAHRNIDTPEFCNHDHIRRCIADGVDLFGRDIKYEVLA